MASANFQTVLIKDDRLVCSPDMSFAVIKGAMNNTVVEYQAISGQGSENPPQITFNVQVPSEQIIIDRRLMIEAEFEFTYTKTMNAGAISNANGGEQVFNNGYFEGQNGNLVYGADALNAFPFHQLVNTAQVTLNNTSVSCNVNDVLTAVMRFNDSRDLNESNGLTPIQTDKVASYSSTLSGNDPSNIINSDNSPFAVADQVDDEAFVPRASFPVQVEVIGAGGLIVPTAGANVESVKVKARVREPLLVSPFTFANPKQNSQGMYGIQNMAIVLNIGNQNRLVRARPQINRNTGAILTASTAVTQLKFTKVALLCNFLTPQPSDLLVPRNVVPYYELPLYRQVIKAVPASVYNANFRSFTTIGRSTSVGFNSIQLNQIPDKLIIFVRPTQSLQNNTFCTDHYLVIEKLNINFNNQAGLLSTFTQSELYRCSRENGSKQSWYEFSGLNQTKQVLSNLSPIGLAGTTVGVADKLISMPMATTGSLLVLCFSKDIELPDYYAPGSLGNFNLSFTLDLINYSPTAIADGQYELCVITMNSGIFATEKGSSSVYTGLLNKEQVLATSTQEPITYNDFNRMVGGSFWDTLKSIGSKVWKGIKTVLPYATKVANVVAPALGPYGAPIATGLNVANRLVSGGAMSAGVMDGGAMGYGMAGGAVSGGRRRKAMNYVS